MRQLLVLILIFLFVYASAQENCADSSTHIKYKTALGDSLHLTKTIVTKDSGKVSIGFFIKGINRDKPFIIKIDNKGEIAWFKKLISPFPNDIELSAIGEAENGNIFVAANTIQLDNKPFFYFVFSASGDLQYQNKFGIPNNLLNLSNEAIDISMVSKFGVDSMLFVLIHPVNSVTTDGMTLLTVSNEGQIGQGTIYAPPIVTSYRSYYSKLIIEDNDIILYGGSHFYNNCMINLREQPAYSSIRINWNNKTILSKKAYCSPPIGYTQFGYPLGEGDDNDKTRIFFQANGNIVYTRRIWGQDFNGTDTLTRIFKVSTFDNNFNHLKSEYLCTPKRFNWWLDWDYELHIDSYGTNYIYAYDFPNKKIYYAVGNSNGNFFLQKQILHNALKKSNRSDISEIILNEPGYFTSVTSITGDSQHSYIDNFRILGKDTAASCFGDDIDFLSSKPAPVSSINWAGNFTMTQAVFESVPVNFITEDYHLERTIICNIINKCDSIKITTSDTICNISQPVIITAYKNPLCQGKVIFTFDTTQVQSYLQVNDTTLSLTFNKSCKVKIFAQPSTCDKLKDSVEIIVNAPELPIDLGSDTIYCPGKTYLLNAANPNFKAYQWQNGSTDSVFIATSSGKHFVTATDYCNRTYSDTIQIIFKDFGINLGKDTSICKGESIILSVPAGYHSYNWAPSYSTTHITPYKVEVNPEINTSYKVEAEVLTGCKLSDTINISVENCPQYLYFPTGFTPNNDGLNDTFRPFTGGVFTKYELQIFNRWGQLVFKTTSKSSGWDGLFKGQLQDNGVFVWQCKYQFEGKPEKLMKGTFMLIR